MGIHGPVCPCCVGGRGGTVSMLVGLLVDTVATLMGRFVSGRLLWRRRGRWDARWLSWAPEPPVELEDGERVPRGRWARRPGVQRQGFRLAALALLAGAAVAPTWLVIAVVAALAVSAAPVAPEVLRRGRATLRREIEWRPATAGELGRARAALPGERPADLVDMEQWTGRDQRWAS